MPFLLQTHWNRIFHGPTSQPESWIDPHHHEQHRLTPESSVKVMSQNLLLILGKGHVFLEREGQQLNVVVVSQRGFNL